MREWEEAAMKTWGFDLRPWDSEPTSEFESRIKHMRKMLPPVVVVVPQTNERARRMAEEGK